MTPEEREAQSLRCIKHCSPLDDASAERDKEMKHLKDMEREANIAEGWRLVHELEQRFHVQIPQRPGWMRAMGADDYIEKKKRRVKEHPESFVEQEERLRRKGQFEP